MKKFRNKGKQLRRIAALILAIIVTWNGISGWQVKAEETESSSGTAKIVAHVSKDESGEINGKIQILEIPNEPEEQEEPVEEPVEEPKVENWQDMNEENGDYTFEVKEGTEYLIKVTPNDGYRVDGLDERFEENTQENSYIYRYQCDADGEGYEFSVNFVKVHTVTLKPGEHGTITVIHGEDRVEYNSKNILELGKKTIDDKESISFEIIPESGYEVTSLTIDEVPIETEESGVELKERNNALYYSYKIDSLEKDIKIEAIFEKINDKEVMEKDNEQVFQENGISFEFEEATDANSKIETDTGVQYILTAGKTVSLKNSDSSSKNYLSISNSCWLNKNIVIDETTTISEIRIRRWIGSSKTIGLQKPITILVDKTAPVLEITSETEKWIVGTETDLKITGNVTENEEKGNVSGIEKVVWTTEPKENEAVIAETTNVVTANEKGDFSIAIGDAPQEDTIYYVYAVDKAKNVSEVRTVEYKVDTAYPEITSEGITVEGIVLNRGTYYTTQNEVTVKVTANDEKSGIKEICLCVDGEVVQTKETTDGTVEFKNVAISKNGSEIAAYAVDNVGNRPLSADEYTKFADGKKIVYDDSVPKAAITIDKTPYCYNGWNYVNSDTDFNIAVSDETSGIKSVSITINGQQITKDINNKDIGKDYENDGESKILEDEFVVSTKSIENVSDNRYTVEVIVKDIADQEYKTTYQLYKDTSKPKVDEIEVIDAAQSETTGIVLNRGTYYTTQNEVSVKVTANDTGSGIKEICLCVDGKVVQTKETTDGNVEFDNVAISKTGSVIAAYAVDNVGNSPASADEYTKFADGKKIVYDDSVPKAAITIDKTPYCYKGWNYVNSDTDFNIAVSDKTSGIKSVSITINGQQITKDINNKNIGKDYENDGESKILEDEFVVSTKSIGNVSDNRYTVEVIVKDITNQEYKTTYQLYKDTSKPKVDGIEVTGATQEGSTTFAENNDTYGFYANDAVEAIVTISDEGDGAGVKSAEYYLMNVDGTESKKTSVAVNKYPGEKAQITIPVQPDFKGYIYVKVKDNAGNVTTKYNTTSGLILEASSNANEKVSFMLEGTEYKDYSGNNLYRKDTIVGVTVEDNYAGIRKVEWSVTSPYDSEKNTSGMVEIDNQGNVSDTAWKKMRTDKNIVTQLNYAIPVQNNSNDIDIKVVVTDRAGNVKESTTRISIDKTAPVMDVNYSGGNPDDANTGYFSDTRKATITVHERNFNAKDIVLNIANTDGVIPEISGWSEQKDNGNPDNNTYVAVIAFEADGDYTWNMNYKDMAGNAANTLATQTFTVDKTVPVIDVSLNGQAANGNYFAESRTATITITEHNFDADRVIITGTATDNGQAISFPATSGWSDNGDVHTASISFDSDGVYSFRVEDVDMAGNVAQQYAVEEYCIDMTEPEIEISGVADMSANNDVVAPVIKFTDTNYDNANAKITLVGANSGEVELNGSFNDSENGQTFTFADFAREQATDDIYTLTAAETDKAGNSVEESIKFSVNRYGSVYVFDDSLKKIEGKYVKEPVDVVLTETNVDALDENSIKVTVSDNGVPKDLVAGTDYKVEKTGGSGSWSQYKYTLDKSLFNGDAKYIVSLYSVDSAGNINENIDVAKEAEIEFGVDGTAPVIVPINIEDDASYNVTAMNANVSVTDNLVLKDVEIKVNGEKVEYTNEGENYNFKIPESSQRQSVKIVAKDAAGNTVECEVKNLLVSTNAFVRWTNNTPVFVGTIAGIGIAGIGIGFVFRLRRKNIIRIKKK